MKLKISDWDSWILNNLCYLRKSSSCCFWKIVKRSEGRRPGALVTVTGLSRRESQQISLRNSIACLSQVILNSYEANHDRILKSRNQDVCCKPPNCTQEQDGSIWAVYLDMEGGNQPALLGRKFQSDWHLGSQDARVEASSKGLKVLNDNLLIWK